MDSAWLHFRSTTAQGDIWLGAGSKDGPWLLAVALAAVASELGIPPAAPSSAAVTAPAGTVYSFTAIDELHDALDPTYRLGVSLPDAPLNEFLAKTKSVPRTTEAERLVVQPSAKTFPHGADGMLERPLPADRDHRPSPSPRFAHPPWAECETDALRLDVHNGLLLSALWDAAFDAGLVSFDDGRILRSPVLTPAAGDQLSIELAVKLNLTEAHRAHLARHRVRHGFSATPNQKAHA